MRDPGLDAEALSGDRGLDSEHHVQIDLLRAFRRAAGDEHAQHEMDEILERLTDYTKAHFASEQLLMRLYNYPQYQEHAADHEATLQRLEEMCQAHREGDGWIAVAAAGSLAQLITSHIRTTDRALGEYLVRLGVGPG